MFHFNIYKQIIKSFLWVLLYSAAFISISRKNDTLPDLMNQNVRKCHLFSTIYSWPKLASNSLW